MKKCVHAHYPEERPAPLRPPSVTGPAEWTTEASWWDLSYKRACCRAQAPWHDGSARPGMETAGWSGFLSAFIISLSTEGEKVFGAVRERAPDSMSRTRVTWHRGTCLYLLLLLLLLLFFVLLKKSGGTSGNQCRGSRTCEETKSERRKDKQRKCSCLCFQSPDKKQRWGKVGDENHCCGFTTCHVTLDSPVHKDTHTHRVQQ